MNEIKDLIESKISYLVWNRIENRVWNRIRSPIINQVGKKVRDRDRYLIESQIVDQINCEVLIEDVIRGE